MTVTHFFVSVICGGVVVVKLIVVGNIELKVRVVIRLGVGIVRRPTPPDRKLGAWGATRRRARQRGSGTAKTISEMSSCCHDGCAVVWVARSLLPRPEKGASSAAPQQHTRFRHQWQ